MDFPFTHPGNLVNSLFQGSRAMTKRKEHTRAAKRIIGFIYLPKTIT